MTYKYEPWYGYSLVKCPACKKAVGVICLSPEDITTKTYCYYCKMNFRVIRQNQKIKEDFE